MLSAKVIQSTISRSHPYKSKMVTMEVVIPTYLLPSFLVHKGFSISYEDIRYVPTDLIEFQVLQNPFIPIDVMPNPRSRNNYIDSRYRLLDNLQLLKSHKSAFSQTLMPYTYTKLCITGTDFMSFFNQRCIITRIGNKIYYSRKSLPNTYTVFHGEDRLSDHHPFTRQDYAYTNDNTGMERDRTMCLIAEMMYDAFIDDARVGEPLDIRDLDSDIHYDHIPYRHDDLLPHENLMYSVVSAYRVSFYRDIEDITLADFREKYIELCNKNILSPMSHIAREMDSTEYNSKDYYCNGHKAISHGYHNFISYRVDYQRRRMKSINTKNV